MCERALTYFENVFFFENLYIELHSNAFQTLDMKFHLAQEISFPQMSGKS